MHRRFLLNDLPVFLEYVPVHQRQQMRFMPDETAPTSFSVRWQTERDPDCQWTADKKWRRSHLVCLIPCT